MSKSATPAQPYPGLPTPVGATSGSDPGGMYRTDIGAEVIDAY